MTVLSWLTDRVVCALRGHQYAPARIYDGRAKTFVPGYRCQRCGRTKHFLMAWDDRADHLESSGDSQ